MRRVNMLEGGNFRLPEFIGSNYSTIPNSDDIPDITPWSVQSAMLSNIQRLVTGLSASAPAGRLLGGGDFTISGNTLTVPPFVGLTESNKIIWTQKPLSITVNNDFATNGGNIYGLHKYVSVEADKDYGKSALRIGYPNQVEQLIVHDEQGAANNDDLNPEDIIIVGSEPSEDYLFLGNIEVDEGTPSYFKTWDMGFGKDHDGYHKLKKILSSDTTVQGQFKALFDIVLGNNGTGTLDIDVEDLNVNGDAGVTENISFLDNDTNTIELEFVNGICINYTKS